MMKQADFGTAHAYADCSSAQRFIATYQYPQYSRISAIYITGAVYSCYQIWIGFGSLLLGLAQLVIALHLILSGDVELNPGPLDNDMF